MELPSVGSREINPTAYRAWPAELNGTSAANSDIAALGDVGDLKVVTSMSYGAAAEGFVRP